MTQLAVVVACVWGVAGLVLLASGDRRSGTRVLAGAAVGGLAVWGSHSATTVGAVAAALVPAAAVLVALGLPDGRIDGGGRIVAASTAVVVALAIGMGYAIADRVPSGLEVAAACTVVVVLVAPSVRRRSRRASAVDRPRLQLLAASVVATAAIALAAGVIALGADSGVAESAVLAAGVVPAVGLAAGSNAAVRRAAPWAVSASVTLLAASTVATFGLLAALLVAGRVPERDERQFVAPAFFAAGVAALAFAPFRRRSLDTAGRWVFGARRRPEDAGRTLTARAAEGVPLDDLVQQLTGSLRGALGAHVVEMWTRDGDGFVRDVSTPDRGAARIECTRTELAALARATVVGDSWLGHWVPSFGAGRLDAQLRVAPAVHTGAVLGLLVVERARDDVPFSEADDRSLAAIGRRLAEVLHARRLDAELTSTLDDLRASRSRLVAAADAERRRIERNLHDGAQQHLVALAVSLRLARDIVRDDPDAGVELLDQLADDVRDTIQQLRDLAHGIYPPLLADSGLAEALRASAQRSPLVVRIDATRRRYPAEVEAAVYFCCLEALQNASKHAPGSEVDLRVWDEDDTLRFEIVDDGPGFDLATTAAGHGFQNMADRLGAIGGRVSWQSVPGNGTRVVGEVVP